MERGDIFMLWDRKSSSKIHGQEFRSGQRLLYQRGVSFYRKQNHGPQQSLVAPSPPSRARQGCSWRLSLAGWTGHKSLDAATRSGVALLPCGYRHNSSPVMRVCAGRRCETDDSSNDSREERQKREKGKRASLPRGTLVVYAI